MLRITIPDDSTTSRFIIEGRLAGDCVSELQRCWETNMLAESHSSILMDLTDVTCIDESGKQLLARMHAQGARFIANGIMMKNIIEEIENAKK